MPPALLLTIYLYSCFYVLSIHSWLVSVNYFSMPEFHPNRALAHVSYTNLELESFVVTQDTTSCRLSLDLLHPKLKAVPIGAFPFAWPCISTKGYPHALLFSVW
jgi:hypothetical protein